ncbi:MAG: hypothetical protein P8L31_12220 [Pseudomonadales bacterium]|nr:hypothetical protein [Pseudomonadales bacterium]
MSRFSRHLQGQHISEQAIDLPENQTAQTEDENLRRLSNILVRPKYTVNFVGYFIGGGLLTIAIVIGATYLHLLDIDQLLNSTQAMGVGGHIPIYDAFTNITTIAIAGLAFFVIYSCVIAIILGHRVAGPITALVDCIEQIKRGNFTYERNLRNNDELGPIHDAIRDLARSLKQSSKASSASDSTFE